MENNKSKYSRIASLAAKKLDSLVLHNKNANEIFSNISNGQNKYLKASRLESASYDPSWIDKIEDCLSDLGDIINNPRKVTKTVTDIVPVELARKTGAESVRHLASHTQFVKEIDENGNVIPNKILNIASDDDYLTYENRFIATLIRKLVLFIEKRYEFATRYAQLKNTEVLLVKSKSVVDGSIVEIESKVTVTKLADDENAMEATNYAKRIISIREYLQYYSASNFMKMFKNERNVSGQILQTNIIRKNPKYRHCYELYRFIERYSQFGVDYKIKESYQAFGNEELDKVNKALLTSFLAIEATDPSHEKLASSKVYKPRILKTIDDDVFVYEPIMSKRPIEFIRLDDEYYQSEEKKLGEIVPHPTKEREEFQKEEAERRRILKEEQKKEKELLKRKAKEQKEFLERQAILKEAERKRREAELARIKEEKRKKELARLVKARHDLKETAHEDLLKELEELKNEEKQNSKETETPKVESEVNNGGEE